MAWVYKKHLERPQQRILEVGARKTQIALKERNPNSKSSVSTEIKQQQQHLLREGKRDEL